MMQGNAVSQGISQYFDSHDKTEVNNIYAAFYAAF
jgi:hypothetical protein